MIDKEEKRVEKLKTENDGDKVKMGGWEGLRNCLLQYSIFLLYTYTI